MVTRANIVSFQTSVFQPWHYRTQVCMILNIIKLWLLMHVFPVCLIFYALYIYKRCHEFRNSMEGHLETKKKVENHLKENKKRE